MSDKPGAEGSTEETNGGSHGNHPERKRMKVSGAERDCTLKISQVLAVGPTARTKETSSGGREAFRLDRTLRRRFNSQLRPPRRGAFRATRNYACETPSLAQLTL